MDIRGWLEALGLGQYWDQFSANAIDEALLAGLDDADLKEIGVSALGHRKKLLTAIAALRVAAEAPPPVLEQRQPSSVERRQLTVMFVDLVGATALSNTLDPEDLRTIIHAYQNVVAGEVSRYGGHVAQFLGDGVLAYFGWPQAHEDSAERAVRTALAVTNNVSRLATAGGGTLETRVGIATGRVVVGDLVSEGMAQRGTAIGETPNLAARLQALAEPGTVLIAESTRALLGEVFVLRAHPARSIRGLAEPAVTYTVEGERDLESRFAARHRDGASPLIGRDEELSLLRERWRRAERGEGQLAFISGEAGIGKSRLTEALIDEVRGSSHFLLRYQCSPFHTDSALYPAMVHLPHAAGFAPDDSTEQKLDKLELLLTQGAQDVQSAAQLIASLLGIQTTRYGVLDLPPERRRAKTLDALVEQLVRLSRTRPVLWAVEDVHWIDPTTLELVELALARVSEARVLIIATARPGFVAPLLGLPACVRLTLDRLPRASANALIAAQTRGKRLPNSVIEQLLARTDGVPLFIEEATRAVLRSDALDDAAGGYVLKAGAEPEVVPASLQDSLLAQLDRQPAAKAVAQLAAVIGRTFDHDTLAASSDVAIGLDDALDQLIESGLVFRRGIPPAATYTFKHALVRDVAYESLLKSRRAELHAQVLDSLERRGSSTQEVLAQHAEAAGRDEQALVLWEQAITQALALPALREALAHNESALRVCRRLGADLRWRRREQALYVQRAQISIPVYGYTADATKEAFEQALAIATELGDIALQLPAAYGLVPLRYVAGKPFREITQRFVALAARQPEDGPLLVADRLQALVHFHDGDFRDANRLFRQAIEGYDPVRHHDLLHRFGQDNRVAAATYQSITEWMLGFPIRAMKTSEQALEWAQPLGHPNTMLYALCLGKMLLAILVGRAGEVASLATHALRLSEQYGATTYVGWSQMARMWATADQTFAGEFNDRTTFGRWRGWTWSLVTETFLKGSNTPAAAACIQNAFDWLQTIDDVAFAAELYRKRAAVLLASDSANWLAAVNDLERALGIAREQAALSWELRAARDLARLWAEAGDRQRALDLLAPVYGAFSEGFETADLEDAAALLTELQ